MFGIFAKSPGFGIFYLRDRVFFSLDMIFRQKATSGHKSNSSGTGPTVWESYDGTVKNHYSREKNSY